MPRSPAPKRVGTDRKTIRRTLRRTCASASWSTKPGTATQRPRSPDWGQGGKQRPGTGYHWLRAERKSGVPKPSVGLEERLAGATRRVLWHPRSAIRQPRGFRRPYDPNARIGERSEARWNKVVAVVPAIERSVVWCPCTAWSQRGLAQSEWPGSGIALLPGPLPSRRNLFRLLPSSVASSAAPPATRLADSRKAFELVVVPKERR